MDSSKSKDEKLMLVMELIDEAVSILSTIDSEKDSETPLTSVAHSFLGKDASPKDLAIDDLGCAESVSNILRKHLGDFPIITGTWTLWQRLENDSRFEKVSMPRSGDIIISPTGTLANAPFPGHTGIMLDNTNVMANRSSTGEWAVDYNLQEWDDRWGSVGFPIYYYRLIG